MVIFLTFYLIRKIKTSLKKTQDLIWISSKILFFFIFNIIININNWDVKYIIVNHAIFIWKI